MSTLVAIALYHIIAEDTGPRDRRWTVPPEIFAQHMQYLQDQKYTPIAVTELANCMVDNGARLPDRPIVLTFDDGIANFYTEALPVLKRYGFTATLYIPTGFVGDVSRWLNGRRERKQLMLTWDQIAEISVSGMECGAHSHSHPQLDILSPADARDEIVRSKAILEEHIGRPVSTFAYPYGYYSAAVRRMVLQAGYSSACAMKHAMSGVADDRFALARIVVPTDPDVNAFAGLLEGRGLKAAPIRERLRTRGWRILRRLARQLNRPPV